MRPLGLLGAYVESAHPVKPEKIKSAHKKMQISLRGLIKRVITVTVWQSVLKKQYGFSALMHYINM